MVIGVQRIWRLSLQASGCDADVTGWRFLRPQAENAPPYSLDCHICSSTRRGSAKHSFRLECLIGVIVTSWLAVALRMRNGRPIGRDGQVAPSDSYP